MKQLHFSKLLLACFCWMASEASAQVYQSDDITVDMMINSTHDSTACSSLASIIYVVTIENSFAGDIAKIKDDQGNEYYQTSNASGQNPWIVTMPFIGGYNISDASVMGGNLYYPFPETKVTTSHDTLYNIQNVIQTPVPDACSFSYVTGDVYIDNNSNCQFDAGDDPLSGVLVSMNQQYSSQNVNSSGWGSTSMSDGMYFMGVLQSWLTIGTISLPSYFAFAFQSPGCSSMPLTYTSLPAENMDIPLNCTGAVDLEANILSSGVVRPNIPFYLSPRVANTGCEAVSGTMKLVLHPEVTYNAALSSNPPSQISGDTLIWSYSNLTNVSSQGYWNSFMSGIHLTPSLNVNIGDTLCFTIISDIPAADINPANNISTICLPVVNSYDPNMKESEPKGVSEPGYIAAETPKLKYTIHFQNTGNAVAYNISVIDTLEENVIPSTLKIIGATHYMEPQWLAPNVVKFNFPYIFLADSTSNEAASHGAVSFEIDMEQGLAPGTTIENTGYIYFDFNSAIVTNTALNTIAFPLGIGESMNQVKIWPNPANNTINFEGISEAKAEMFDMAGKLVFTGNVDNSLDVSNLNEGVYSVVLTTQNGISVQKVIIAR